jgi:hypothetical protein
MTNDLDLGIDIGHFHTTTISPAAVARKLRENVSAPNPDYFVFIVPERGEEELQILRGWLPFSEDLFKKRSVPLNSLFPVACYGVTIISSPIISSPFGKGG